MPCRIFIRLYESLIVKAMQYPTLLEYMKAIQDAGNNLDKLSHLSVVLDGHGEPCHISGDSSVVFKMQDKTTGKCYASSVIL